MTKTSKIIYWVATIWLALGMVSTGIVQIIKQKDELTMITGLGYPEYFLPLIGAAKIAGAIAVLLPGFPVIKEWAYAGFFFTMFGAIFSHAVKGDAAPEFFGPVLLIILTLISWYFRPAGRKPAGEILSISSEHRN